MVEQLNKPPESTVPPQATSLFQKPLHKTPTSVVPKYATNPFEELLLIRSYEEALSLFGIKTAEGAEEFFQSAAGKALTNQLEAKVADEQAIKHAQEIEQNDRMLLETKLMAALLLFFLDKKAQASKTIEEIIQDQERHEHKAPTPKPTATPADEKKKLEQEAAFYEALSKTTLEHHQVLQKEEAELLKRLSDLTQSPQLEPSHPKAKEHQEQLTIAQQNLARNQATQALMTQKAMEMRQGAEAIQSRINPLNTNAAPQPQATAPRSQTSSATPPTGSPKSADLMAAPNTPTPTTASTVRTELNRIKPAPTATQQTPAPTTPSPLKMTPGNT